MFFSLRTYQYNLNILTYSHYGLISDLLSVLFNETNYQPWINSKYIKRLYRLIYIVVLSYLALPKINNSYDDVISKKNYYSNYNINLTKKIKHLKKIVDLLKILFDQNRDKDVDFYLKIKKTVNQQLNLHLINDYLLSRFVLFITKTFEYYGESPQEVKLSFY